MIQKVLFLIAFLALCSVAHSQGSAENVVLYNEDDGLVTICYDLVAEGPKRVTLIGSADGFELEIDAVSGDIGVMILPGQDRCAFWESREDYPDGFEEYAVKLELLVTDYEPIGEVREKVEKEQMPEGHVPISPNRAMKKKVLSEQEMLDIISDQANEAKGAKRNCEKAQKRYDKAADSGSKARVERLKVQKEFVCREYSSLKQKLYDYVLIFEERTDSNKARKYLRALE